MNRSGLRPEPRLFSVRAGICEPRIELSWNRLPPRGFDVVQSPPWVLARLSCPTGPESRTPGNVSKIKHTRQAMTFSREARRLAVPEECGPNYLVLHVFIEDEGAREAVCIC